MYAHTPRLNTHARMLAPRVGVEELDPEVYKSASDLRARMRAAHNTHRT